MILMSMPPALQFYLVTAYCCGIATFAYYAMLSGQGWLISPSCRQLFYVRYIDWFVTTPLILVDLALIVGADWCVPLLFIRSTRVVADPSIRAMPSRKTTPLCLTQDVCECHDRGGSDDGIWRVYGCHLFGPY